MSLRARLLIGLVALATIGLVAANAATYASLRTFLLHRVDEQLGTAPRSVLFSLGRRPGPGPRPPGGPLPIGLYAQLRDDAGEVLLETRSNYPAPELPEDPDLSGRPVTVHAVSGPSSYRMLAQPLEGGTLIVAIPLDDVQRTLGRLLAIEVLVTAGVLIGLTALALWVVRLGLRPLEDIGATATAIAGGDLGRRVEQAEPRTEIGRLGLALNAMLTQIERAFAERKASEDRLRRFLADASHELRTPLTSIRGYAELFRRGADVRPDDLAKAMSRIEQESGRMGVLVDDLLLLARLDQGRPLDRAPVDLVVVAADAVHDASTVDPSREIALDADGSVVVNGDEVRLRQVAANLLSNAIEHTPGGTPVEVRVRVDGADAVLEVTDHGPGLEPDDAGRVFERFYRSDPSRTRGSGGAGLGLSIVAAIAYAHGGSAAVESTPGDGATFRVRLPLDGATAVNDDRDGTPPHGG